jgi:hypothetical protein
MSQELMPLPPGYNTFETLRHGILLRRHGRVIGLYQDIVTAHREADRDRRSRMKISQVPFKFVVSGVVLVQHDENTTTVQLHELALRMIGVDMENLVEGNVFYEVSTTPIVIDSLKVEGPEFGLDTPFEGDPDEYGFDNQPPEGDTEGA